MNFEELKKFLGEGSEGGIAERFGMSISKFHHRRNRGGYTEFDVEKIGGITYLISTNPHTMKKFIDEEVFQ